MKRLVTLALAGVCALAFVAASDAATTIRQGNKIVNTKTSETTVFDGKDHKSTVYANTATNSYSYQDGHWQIDYIYSNDITRSSVVFDNLKKALNNPYSDLVPSIVNEQTTVGLHEYKISKTGTTDGSVNVNADADWTDVASVANNVIPGRCARMDGAKDAGGVDTDAVEEEAEERETGLDEAITTDSKSFISHLGTKKTDNVTFQVVDGQLIEVHDVNLIYLSEKTTIVSKSQNKYVSPIVLDMTGNGVLQASNGQNMPGHPVVTTNVILADFYGDGFEIGMEWVGPQDGLLVAPKADGSVDMSSLFGTAGGYETGYEKLSLYDNNNDGLVNGEELVGLSVWQDANGNGVADAGEVKTVQELGITEISLNANANFVSSFTMNGKTNKMWDWWPNAMEVVKLSAK
jgi:hypothetical protein